jgi:hypothetical protein
MPKRATPKVWVREVFANGDERCEVPWPAGAEGVDSPGRRLASSSRRRPQRRPRDQRGRVLVHPKQYSESPTSGGGLETRAQSPKKHGPDRGGNGTAWDEARTL